LKHQDRAAIIIFRIGKTMDKVRNLNSFIFTILLILCSAAQAAEPQISAGRYHNLAVTNRGDVYWWGQEYGLSHYAGQPSPIQSPALVVDLPPINAVAAGTWHSVALAQDGAVFEWGFSPFHISNSQLNDMALSTCETARLMWTGHGKDPCAEEEKASYAKMHLKKAVRVAGIPPARAIAAGDFVTAMVSIDGLVYCWDTVSLPQRIPGLEKIKAIRLGQFYGVALRDDGTVLTWGSNVHGELGSAPYAPPDGDNICSNPAPRAVLRDAEAIGISVSTTYALRADGSVWGWSSNSGNTLGGTTTKNEDNIPTPREIATITRATQIAGGLLHAVALDSEGKVYAWGSNDSNNIWAGDTLLHSAAPVYIATLAAIRGISSSDHTLALTQDGFVCAWGDNAYGAARPDSTLRNIPAPVPVMLANGATPLQLVENRGAVSEKNAPICGVADWRAQVAMWEAAIVQQDRNLKLLQEKVERRWKSERDLFRKVRSAGSADVRKGSTALETAMVIRDYGAMQKLLYEAGSMSTRRMVLDGRR
jgi:alpha-tubulin suppressor-like RCC1 family protein